MTDEADFLANAAAVAIVLRAALEHRDPDLMMDHLREVSRQVFGGRRTAVLAEALALGVTVEALRRDDLTAGSIH
jgi:DNA-binding phage protein